MRESKSEWKSDTWNDSSPLDEPAGLHKLTDCLHLTSWQIRACQASNEPQSDSVCFHSPLWKKVSSASLVSVTSCRRCDTCHTKTLTQAVLIQDSYRLPGQRVEAHALRIHILGVADIVWLVLLLPKTKRSRC